MRWADVYVPHVSPASMSPASMRRCPRALSPRLGQRAQSVEQDGSLVRERHGGQGTWSERATSRRLGRLLSRRGGSAVVVHARLHWSWAKRAVLPGQTWEILSQHVSVAETVKPRECTSSDCGRTPMTQK